MPGLKQRIGGNECRHIVIPKPVKRFRKIGGRQTFAYHETVLAQKSLLRCVEPEIIKSVPFVRGRKALVVHCRVRGEARPVIGRPEIPINPGEILICRRVARCKLRHGDLPQPLQFGSQCWTVAEYLCPAIAQRVSDQLLPLCAQAEVRLGLVAAQEHSHEVPAAPQAGNSGFPVSQIRALLNVKGWVNDLA